MLRQRIVIGMVLGLGSTALSAGATRHVYAGESIQAAINVAAEGDEIIAHPGTYGGAIDFVGKAIVLRSADGWQATILDGQQAGPVVTCHTGEGAGTVLEGFTIRRGVSTSQGGGMRIAGASPTVRNCLFQNNQAQYGGAVFVDSGRPTFEGCQFAENVATGSGGAAYCYRSAGPCEPVLRDCRFGSNRAESAGGAMRNWDSSPMLERCRFEINHARYSGAGVANGGDSQPQFTNCTFEANQLNALQGNWDGSGGAMGNTDSSSPVLVNCVFADNLVTVQYPYVGRGGALASSGTARPQLHNCTFSANHANVGQALSNVGTAQVHMASSILWDGGNEIVSEGGAVAVVEYCQVQGGWPGVGNNGDDPQLVDWRLGPDSPCINAGDPNAAPPAVRDLDGHARVLGGRIDMGAYEFGIGDVDGDRNVDGQDFVVGAGCMTGPDRGPYGAGCEAVDFEYDGDVDLADVAAWQLALTE